MKKCIAVFLVMAAVLLATTSFAGGCREAVMAMVNADDVQVLRDTGGVLSIIIDDYIWNQYIPLHKQKVGFVACFAEAYDGQDIYFYNQRNKILAWHKDRHITVK